ncbi:MAG TPA: uracil-DNA glycosylase [Candidatus Dormibacteraeota bacterium]|nr:uracil-DNA glycosylase [Candidatus Dormibacteraeota bacterium]
MSIPQGAELAEEPTSGAQARLEAIAAQVRDCVLCPLHLTRTQAVPGIGPATARVMAVGEAPGENEDREGKPFVGAAGRLLTELLQEIGLSREDLFITNVLKSRPPGNRDPLPEEVLACAPYLDAQIEVLQPEVILLLGRHALQRLLPEAPGISRAHGTLIRRGDRTYMPCYHPAAALYNGGLLGTLRQDFQRLKAHLEKPAATSAPFLSDRSTPAPADEQLGLF